MKLLVGKDLAGLGRDIQCLRDPLSPYTQVKGLSELGKN